VGIGHICEFQHPTPVLISVRLPPEAPLAEPKGGDSLSTHPFTLAARVQARDPPRLPTNSAFLKELELDSLSKASPENFEKNIDRIK